MASLAWTIQAEEDLDNIVRYIALDNVEAALWLDGVITTAAAGLAIQPFMGKPGRVPQTREYVPHKHYVIVYSVEEDAVEILAVLHTSQEWPPAKEDVPDAGLPD